MCPGGWHLWYFSFNETPRTPKRFEDARQDLNAKQSQAGISSCEKAQTQAPRFLCVPVQDSLCTMAYVRRPRPALERGESHSPMLVMGILGILLMMQSHMALPSGVGA